MIKLKTTLAILLITCFSNSFVHAQELLDNVPETKEEFVKSEKQFIASVNWIEQTEFNTEVNKHKTQYQLITAWLINSPTVTIEINADVIKFSKKNSELLVFFMAGWGKYVLENNYSKDVIKGNLAGLKSVIQIYKKGNGLKKDKEIDKLIVLDDKGQLESWVKNQLDIK